MMSEEKRPEWMESISGIVNPEDYLLGRKIDKTFELSQEEKAQRAREVRAELIANNKIILAGDPILELERRREQLKLEIIQNPIKLRQLREKLLREEREQNQLIKPNDDNLTKSPRSVHTRDKSPRGHYSPRRRYESPRRRYRSPRRHYSSRKYESSSRYETSRSIRKSPRKRDGSSQRRHESPKRGRKDSPERRRKESPRRRRKDSPRRRREDSPRKRREDSPRRGHDSSRRLGSPSSKSKTVRSESSSKRRRPD